jgi:hypothetical protein
MADHPDCIAVTLDCVSKYPVIDGYGDDCCHPFVTLGATATTLDVVEGFSKHDVTRVTFTSLKGTGKVGSWYIFSAVEGGRYTVNIVFLKRGKRDN